VEVGDGGFLEGRKRKSLVCIRIRLRVTQQFSCKKNLAFGVEVLDICMIHTRERSLDRLKHWMSTLYARA
jgi:hypothetical protein